MKERKRDKEVEESSEKLKFREIFTVLVQNSQVRYSIIGILLYYTGSTILVSLGLNYFYFNFGYSDAGTYQLYFTIVYAAATLIGQAIFPLLVNKLKIKRMTVFTWSCIITIVGYILLFFYVFLDPRTYFVLMCLVGFIVFMAQTFVSLILYIMIQDAIEYNEYKFDKRNESAVFSLRAFTAKLGSSIQQLVLYCALVAGSLYGISNKISGFEAEAISKYGDQAEKVGEYVRPLADSITGADHIELVQRVVYQVGFTLVPCVLMLACLLVIKIGYKINEESHRAMVIELEKRKEALNDETK